MCEHSCKFMSMFLNGLLKLTVSSNMALLKVYDL